MQESSQKSQSTTIFHAFPALEDGVSLAGYAALIAGNDLCVPTPDYLCVIGIKHRKYNKGHWRIFTPRHRPDDSLAI